MLILAVQGGHLETMRRLLDAGARVDGDPESEDDPLGQACWRGRVEIVRELVKRGAALSFRNGGSAIGATLHGSRHCQNPEGGPSMALVEEIPTEPYAEIVRILLAAGAPVPERIGDPQRGPRAVNLIAELGLDPPA
jgi:Ankyrin repeats (many copies)